MLERYYHELLNFVARSTGCRESARDIVQETYTRLLSESQQLRRRDHSAQHQLASLYKTARHILIDQYRRRLISPEESVTSAQEAMAHHGEPEAQLVQRQEVKLLLAAIDSLPPRCRQAFVRYKLDGASQVEIAEEMGISVNMVEKHVIRGMVACKQAMAQGGAGRDIAQK